MSSYVEGKKIYRHRSKTRWSDEMLSQISLLKNAQNAIGRSHAAVMTMLAIKQQRQKHPQKQANNQASWWRHTDACSDIRMILHRDMNMLEIDLGCWLNLKTYGRSTAPCDRHQNTHDTIRHLTPISCNPVGLEVQMTDQKFVYTGMRHTSSSTQTHISAINLGVGLT
jgi:hypothetical protein